MIGKLNVCAPGLSVLMVALTLLAASRPAMANPSGESVAFGQALFERNGNQLSITTSDKVIINWGDFSISAGELTQFLQPGANSLALNRVMTGIPSNISGILQANGGIILVNPAGIMVGPGGQINVGSFIGSTLDIPDANFIAGGDLHFSGDSQAKIVNLGTVNATSGDVFLLARQIENHGLISAPLGTVGLGAGQEIILRPAGAERRLEVIPTADSNGGVGILNSGTIQGATAELMTNGGNAYSMAIHNTGTIEASGVAVHEGRIFLTGPNNKVVNEGTLKATRGKNGGEIHIDALEVITTATSVINASGTDEGQGGLVTISGAPANIVDGKVVTGAGPGTASANGGGKVLIDGEIVATGLKGGEINVLSNNIELQNNARLNADGLSQGGRVRIGGNFQGGADTGLEVQGMAKPEDFTQKTGIYNADNVAIRAGAHISASALQDGNGGTVIVWADKKTDFRGTIEAKGGVEGGDGGFVEVSGKEHLAFRGDVNTSAPQGNKGQLLLDPDTITIQATDPDIDGAISAAEDDITDPGDLDDPVADFPNSDSIITSGALEALLVNNDVTLAAEELITVDDAIDWATNFNLTFNSLGDIVINSAITNTGGGAFTAASSNIIVNANVSVGANLNLYAGTELTLAAGVDISGANVNMVADTYTYDATSTVTASGVGGQVAFRTNIGTVLDMDDFLGILPNVTADATLFGVNTANLEINSDVVFGSNLGAVILEGDLANPSNILISADIEAGDITFNTLGTVSLGGVIDADSITINADTANSVDVDDVFTAESLVLNLVDGGSLFTAVETLEFTNTGLGALEIFNTGELFIVNNATSVGDITIETASPQTVNVNMMGANINLTTNDDGGANADDLTINGVSLTATAGNINLNSGDSVIVNSGSALSATNAVNINSRVADGGDNDGDVELAGSINSGAGNINVNSGGGAVNNVPGAATLMDQVIFTAGAGNIFLDNAANDFQGTVHVVSAANTTLSDANSIVLGSVAGGNVVSISAIDDITQIAPIGGTSLALRTTTGSAILNTSNNTFTNIAADVAVNLLYRNSAGLNIGAVDGLTGITAGTDVLLNTAGALTQSEAISATGLAVDGTGSVNFTEDNDVDNFAADRNSFVRFTDIDDLFITTVQGIVGVDIGGSALTLTAGGLIEQDQAITVGGLRLSGAGAAVLTDGSNLITGFAADIGGARVNDADGYSITTVDGLAGVQMLAGEILSLGSESGPITQTQAIVVGNLLLTGSGATTLTLGTNDVGTLASDRTGGDLRYRDSNALIIGTVLGVNGIDASADLVSLRVGSLTQTQAIIADELAIRSQNTVDLTGALNQVTSLAIQVDGVGDILFREQDFLDITTVDSIVGLDTGDGAVAVTVEGDDEILEINEAINATTSITLVADKMRVLDNVDAGSGDITLRSFEAGDAVDLGSATNAAADTLELANAELDRLFTATGTVTIGSLTQGPITVTAALSPANFSNLSLISDGAILLNDSLTVTDSIAMLSANADITGVGLVTTDQLTVNAQTGIDIVTAVNTVVSAITEGAGALIIDNQSANAIEFVSVQAADGLIDLDSLGDITATSILSLTGGNSVFITTTTGDIETDTIDATTVAGSFVSLTATAGSIVDVGGPNVDVTSDSALFVADGSIGSSLDALETAVNELIASSTGAGDIFISNTSADLAISMSTNDGEVNVTTSDDLTVDFVRTGLAGVNPDDNDIFLESTNGNMTLTGRVWAADIDDAREADPAFRFAGHGSAGGDVTLIAMNGDITQERNFTGSRAVFDADGVLIPSTFAAVAGKENDVIIADVLDIQAGGDVILENDRFLGDTTDQLGNQINTLFLRDHSGSGNVYIVRDSQDGLFVDGTPGGVTFDGYQTSISTRTGREYALATFIDLGASANDNAREEFWHHPDGAIAAYNMVLRTPIATNNGRTILAVGDGLDFIRIAGPDRTTASPADTAEDPANLLPKQADTQLVDATQVLTNGAGGSYILYTRTPDPVGGGPAYFDRGSFLYNLEEDAPVFQVPGPGQGTTFDRDQNLVDQSLPLPFDSRPGLVVSGIVYAFNPDLPEIPPSAVAPDPITPPAVILDPFIPAEFLDAAFLDIVIDFTSLVLGIEGDESGIRLSAVDDEEQRKRAREKLERREEAQPVGLSIGPYTNSYYDEVAETFEVRLELNETQVFRL